MGRVLIIGAGGVGTVVAHKVAQNADVFTDIMIASRTKEKCDKIVPREMICQRFSVMPGYFLCISSNLKRSSI